ncbi:POK9 protein, partial [Steatornis caripensis]|nr:POK9 protein [Steatornis caripensis]NWX51768.1 POK9 protein [Steatornis caripensis]
RGSLGIDLAAAIDIPTATTAVHKIPTGIKGPVYNTESTVGALLIGRSSAGTAGLIVLPGVIDADYTGEIIVAAFTLSPPLIIPKGTRIAQLVIYERHATAKGIWQQAPARADNGFGSTRDTLVNLVQRMQQRPLVLLTLRWDQDKCQIQAMLDTGADVMIFS